MKRYLLALLSLPVALSAQTARDADASISVGSRAEVRIPADHATLVIAVETRAPTAAAAASDNARINNAVLAALKGAGSNRSQIGSAGYIVRQNWRYDNSTRQQKLDGYIAENSIRIEISKLDRIGAYIDTALAAGATRASDLTFSATASEQARHTALANAMAIARGDAAGDGESRRRLARPLARRQLHDDEPMPECAWPPHERVRPPTPASPRRSSRARSS